MIHLRIIIAAVFTICADAVFIANNLPELSAHLITTLTSYLPKKIAENEVSQH